MTRKSKTDGTAGWRTVGASVVGTAHMELGRRCEDRSLITLLQDDGIALVVADGAGSAVGGAQGADAAIRGAEQGLLGLAASQGPSTEEGWYQALQAIVDAARRAVEDEFSHIVSEGNTNVRYTPDQAERHAGVSRQGDLATTLVVAVAWAGWLGVVQIGDGYVVARTATGGMSAVGVPERGEHINETRFLTDADYTQHTRYVVQPAQDLDSFAVLTDGLELLAWDLRTQTPFAPFFEPLFAFAGRPGATEAELAAFLQSPRVCARTTDDKTLLLAVRSCGGETNR